MDRTKKIWIWIVSVLTVLALLALSVVASPPLRSAVRGVVLRVGDRIEKRIPVLLYHHLYQEGQREQFAKNPMALPVDTFRQHMKLLHDNGFVTITASDLRGFIQSGKQLPDRCVLITFDDGYESVCQYAYPVLKEYGFHAVIFAETSKMIWEDIPFDPNGLQYLHQKSLQRTADVFEFGSHTHAMHWVDNHKRPVLTTMSESEILTDLQTSRRILNTDIFAYPYGSYRSNTVRLVQQAGYQMGFDNKDGRVTRRTDLFRIPRYTIFQKTSIERFCQDVGI